MECKGVAALYVSSIQWFVDRGDPLAFNARGSPRYMFRRFNGSTIAAIIFIHERRVICIVDSKVRRSRRSFLSTSAAIVDLLIAALYVSSIQWFVDRGDPNDPHPQDRNPM